MQNKKAVPNYVKTSWYSLLLQGFLFMFYRFLELCFKEFAKFYRSLDAYRQSFNKPQDMMVVDPSSEFFDYLKNSRGEAQANKQP